MAVSLRFWGVVDFGQVVLLMSALYLFVGVLQLTTTHAKALGKCYKTSDSSPHTQTRLL